MEESTKKEIARLVRIACQREGWNQSRFAATVPPTGVSVTTISSVCQGKRWETVSDKMWQRLAAVVNYHSKEWNIVATDNLEAVERICTAAQHKGISMAIAHDAGSGKTQGLKTYAQQYKNVFYLECDNYWTQRHFLGQLYRTMGKEPKERSALYLAEAVISELRRIDSPLVIIDEIDKLSDRSLLYFISLYNKLDGGCGFVLSGAPFLRMDWEKKARRDKRGFREIHSRIGKSFMPLNNVRLEDVTKICEGNGVTDKEQILQVFKKADGDLRTVKRQVERIQLQQTKANAA